MNSAFVFLNFKYIFLFIMMFYNYNNYLGQVVMAILLGFSVYNTLQHLVF